MSDKMFSDPAFMRGYNVKLPDFSKEEEVLKTAILIDLIWTLAHTSEVRNEFNWNLTHLRGACEAISSRLTDPTPLTAEDLRV